jgi:hypothetical protein
MFSATDRNLLCGSHLRRFSRTPICTFPHAKCANYSRLAPIFLTLRPVIVFLAAYVFFFQQGAITPSLVSVYLAKAHFITIILVS